MPEFTPLLNEPREHGRLLACEGILRARFGHRPTEAARRAIEQLESEELAGGSRVVFPDSMSDEIRADSNPNKVIPFPAWAKWTAVAACLIAGLFFFLLLSPDNSVLRIKAAGKDSAGFIERGGQRLPAVTGLPLEPGDLVLTGTNASLTLVYEAEPTEIGLGLQTELKLIGSNRGKRFELRGGKLLAHAAHQRWFHPMMVRTPQAEARVLGTRFEMSASSQATRLEVIEGKVRFTRMSDGAALTVTAGNYALAAADREFLVQPVTGSILRQYWTNFPGVFYTTFLTSNPNYPDHPNGSEYLNKFEAPIHWGKNYGARIRGYLHPPRTGEYSFWLSASDGGELWLSPDDNPDHKQQIGYAANTGFREWEKGRGQPSSSIPLVAGRKYYIEALHKQGNQGEDHLEVAWQGPGRDREVIPGEFLSPGTQAKGTK